MRWDAPLLATLARTLDDRLAGARLRAFAPDFPAQRMVLHFREATLLVRLQPKEAGVFVMEPAEPPPDARRMSARLRSVATRPDDRVLVFSFQRLRARPARVDFVVEWMTPRHNLIVTVGAERTARLVFHTREGERAVRQGRPYRFPETPPREGVDGGVTEERWREVVAGLPPGREGRRALLSTFAWTSPLNAESLLRAGADEGWRRWQQLVAIVRGERDPEPVLLETERGLQPYPLPLPPVPHRPMGSILAAVDEAARDDGETAGPTLLPSTLLERLDRHVAQLRTRTTRLEERLAHLPDPDRAQAHGDLILARYDEIPHGAGRVVLTDFEGRPVEVPLDPALAPHEQARAHYDEAARIRRAAAQLPPLIAEARDAWARAADLRERAGRGEVTAAELAEALPDRGGPGDDEAPTLPYRRYRSSGGLEIRVGRGAKRNDDLTFRHSAPDDIWLHARDAAGAHVILRWPHADNPPARDLAEAAVLAALGSRARTSGSVPVDWTRRKYVRKPRKAPPGLVTPARVQTLFVHPDPAVERRLRVEG